jgi:hypothetical protein
METFLNFLWVLMALAGLGVWRACWMREHPVHRRDPVREWAAVICALVLLFFAVSLSDDLRSSLALLEESAGSRRHSTVWDAHPSPDARQATTVTWALPTNAIFVPLLSDFISLRLTHVGNATVVESTPQFGRAPPYDCL